MAFTSAALASEINTDPLAYGYAAFVAAGNDAGVANLLNLPRDGSDGKPAISVKRADCSPLEILEAIDIRDFLASPTGVNNIPLTQSWLESITQFARVRLTNDDGSKTNVRKNIDRVIGTTQGSQARLDAVAVRSGSRAEQLFGAGVVVTTSDISLALRGV